MPFSLLLIPVLFIAAGISIPWIYIDRRMKQRRERRFANEMQAVGRSIAWKELEAAIENNQGTIVGEYLSGKGPYRLWWTEEDIPAVSPHKWKRDLHFAGFEEEFVPFFQWCYERYTNSQSGTAKLVIMPPKEHKGLDEKLKGTRFVSTCSFVKLFGKAEK